MKSLIVTKIVQIIRFEGDLGELEANNCFQKQSWKKHIRQKLYFSCEITQYEKTLSFIFRQISASMKQILSLGEGLDTRL